ncbi:MAG: hypothetical protein ABL889_22780, partial [Terricaulis sp.]
APDSKSGTARCVGSTPTGGTILRSLTRASDGLRRVEGPLRIVLVAMTIWAMSLDVRAQEIGPASAAAALDFCARTVSVGPQSIETEADARALPLGSSQRADSVAELRQVLGFGIAPDARVRVASFAAGSVAIDEHAENCFIIGRDETLAQRFHDESAGWQFAYTDQLSRSSAFDRAADDASARSVRALTFAATRSEPIALTHVSRAQGEILPRVTDDVRVAWVRLVIDVCVAHTQRGDLPSAAEFAPYLVRDESDQPVAGGLRSPRGQPQARLWIGARDGTCSIISGGEQGRLLKAAAEADLRARGARGESGGFELAATVPGGRDVGVLVMEMMGGQFVIFIAPG